MICCLTHLCSRLVYFSIGNKNKSEAKNKKGHHERKMTERYIPSEGEPHDEQRERELYERGRSIREVDGPPPNNRLQALDQRSFRVWVPELDLVKAFLIAHVSLDRFVFVFRWIPLGTTFNVGRPHSPHMRLRRNSIPCATLLGQKICCSVAR